MKEIENKREKCSLKFYHCSHGLLPLDLMNYRLKC